MFTMNTSASNTSPIASTDYSRADVLLEEAAALALGAVSREDAQRIRRELTQASSAEIHHEYRAMTLAAQLLPASLTLAEPPANLKERILSRLHSAESVTAIPAANHERHEEFIPQYDAQGADFYALSGDEGEWLPHPVKGIAVKPLATDKERGYATILMRLDAGVNFPSHSHEGAEQCYIISGDIYVRGQRLAQGSFFSTSAHANHGDISTTQGATVLLVVAMEDYRKSAWRVGLKAVRQRFARIFS